MSDASKARRAAPKTPEAALAEMRRIAARRATRAMDEDRDYMRLRHLWRTWKDKIATNDMADASRVQAVTVRKQRQ